MEPIHKPAMRDKSQTYQKVCGSFIPVDVLAAFDAEFLVEAFCRYWVIRKLYPDDQMRCPGCGSNIPEGLLRSFWDNKRLKCDRCGKYFTALTDTFLSGCHFNFGEIVLLAFMISLGVSDKQIAKTLKISAENVRLWRHRFEAIEKSKKIGSGG